MSTYNKCKVVKHYKFLFLEWDNVSYIHDWVYENKLQRKCKRCGAKEMLYDVYRREGYLREDWRQAQ